MPSPAEKMYPGGPNTDLGNGFGKYPSLTADEWKQWKQLPMTKGKVYAPKSHDDLPGMLKDNPQGFVVHKENPNLGSIEKEADVLSIPDDDINLFVRPKPAEALTS